MESQSLNILFEDSFKKNWDRPALSNYQGRTLTYGELAMRIRYLHLCFERCGLEKGDKVALCSRNQANWGVAFLATLTYGAVAVPILHEFKPENIRYLVNHSEAKVFFVDESIWEHLSEMELPGVSVVVQMNTLKYLYAREQYMRDIRAELSETFAGLYPSGFTKEDVSYYRDSPEELAVINYTSGTSGFSKGVMIPFRALVSNIRFAGTEAEPGMNCESNVVAMLPSAHMYGMMFEFLFEVTLGAHVQFLTRLPSPKTILKAFQEIHPDVIISVPLIIEKVYKAKIKDQVEKNRSLMWVPFLGASILKKFRDSLVEAFGGNFEEVIIGGAAFNPEVEEFLTRIKFPFTVGYGMTECSPIITYSHWNETRRGSCGKAVRGCEIKIDSPDPINVPGNILVKGPNVFLGYFKNEKATSEAFTEDGWFRTGDVGVIDADGYLYIRGRSKCMILGPSGQNIYPEELEAVLNSETYVFESLVIEDNSNLTALIYPDYKRGEADGMDKDAVHNLISGRIPEINKILPAYAQIRKVEFMPEDFERTPKKSIKRYLYQRTDGKI